MKEPTNVFPFETPWGPIRIMFERARGYQTQFQVTFFSYTDAERREGGDEAIAKTALRYKTRLAETLYAVRRYVLTAVQPPQKPLHWETNRGIGKDPCFLSCEVGNHHFYITSSSGYAPFAKFFRESIDKWVQDHPKEMAEAKIAMSRIEIQELKAYIKSMEEGLDNSKERLRILEVEQSSQEERFFSTQEGA